MIQERKRIYRLDLRGQVPCGDSTKTPPGMGASFTPWPCQRMAGLQGQARNRDCLRSSPFCFTVLGQSTPDTVHEPWLSELNCCCQWGNPKPDISELLRVSHSAFTALLHAKHLHIDKKLGINALNNPLTQKCPYLSKWTGTSEIWKVPSKYHPTWLSTPTGEGRMADFTFSFSLLSWEHCACLLQRAWDFVIMAIVWKLKIGKYCSPPSVH